MVKLKAQTMQHWQPSLDGAATQPASLSLGSQGVFHRKVTANIKLANKSRYMKAEQADVFVLLRSRRKGERPLARAGQDEESRPTIAVLTT